ncbi:hypothetical protein CDAR_572061 [Caerostris darwini]|uniref:Uncharacterized protein n=1 Tax=Caerostris darwini TaxID=1538125 RepID=A0AAV4T1H3_9ARAC|nr:hypothetical protein CDAR_572061 [Caerostris darwini]
MYPLVCHEQATNNAEDLLSYQIYMYNVPKSCAIENCFENVTSEELAGKRSTPKNGRDTPFGVYSDHVTATREAAKQKQIGGNMVFQFLFFSNSIGFRK